MRRVYVTLVGRVDKHRDSPEDVGELVVLDWDTRTVLNRVIVDSGKLVEKGRSRGASGITWLDGSIYVGCRAGIVRMDPDTFDYEVLDIEVPSSLHQIKSHEGKLYLTGAGDNSLVVIEGDKMVGRTILGSADVPLHFNSIGWDSNGDQYHLYMGSILNPKPTRKCPSRIINFTTGTELHGHLGVLPHDLCFIKDDRLLYTSSAAGEIISINLKTRDRFVLFSKEIKSNPGGGYRVQGLLRGLAFDDATNAVLVGSAPGIIHELDADTGEERSSVNFSNTAGTAVYDILLDPRDWVVDYQEELPVPEAVEAPKKSRFRRLRDWFKRKK